MFALIRKSIESTFAAGWPTASEDTPYCFDNVPLKQTDPKRFVRLSIRLGRPVNHTIGTKRVPKMPGVVMIQIFTPKNAGNEASKALADIATGLFEYRQFREGGVTITFEDPGELQPTGVRTDFYQENLILRFLAHEVVTVPV